MIFFCTHTIRSDGFISGGMGGFQLPRNGHQLIRTCTKPFLVHFITSLTSCHPSAAAVAVPSASDFDADRFDGALIADAVRLVGEFVRERRHLRFTPRQLAAAMADAEGDDAAGGTRWAPTISRNSQSRRNRWSSTPLGWHPGRAFHISSTIWEVSPNCIVLLRALTARG